MFKKINNILDTKLFNDIKEHVCSDMFPWFYIPDSAFDNTTDTNKTKKYSFYHTTMKEKKSNSFFNENTMMIANIMKDQFHLNDYEILRLRWGMSTNNAEKIIHNPHIDFYEQHKVILYYLNESDGDTYFYDNQNNIINQNTPEENSAILFEGNIKHSSSKPIKYDRRIILNINLVSAKNNIKYKVSI